MRIVFLTVVLIVLAAFSVALAEPPDPALH